MVGVTSCLGISHPSGQAVYHLLGKVFLLLPFGTSAYKIGLLSALCGALALWLFYLLCLELAARWGGWKDARALPSTLRTGLLLLTLLWGLSLPWWKVSTQVEVYAMHLAFMMGVLWVLTLEKPFKWPLVLFLAGVATIFRPTQMLVLPWIGILFLVETFGGKGRTPAQGRWRLVAMTLLGFVLGRGTLLYLPLRSALEPPMAYADLTGPSALIRHVLGLGFSGSIGTATGASLLSALSGMAHRAWTDLTPVGVMLLVGGMVILIRNARKAPAFLWIGLAWGGLETFLVLAVPYPTFEPHMTLLIWASVGWLAALSLAWFHRRFPGDGRRTLALTAILGLGVLLQLSGLRVLWEDRGSRAAEDFARNILGMMGPSALYVPAEENEYFPVAGIQSSEGLREDVRIVMPGTPLEVLGPQVARALGEGRKVYLTREWEGLPPGWGLRRLGPLLEISKRPSWEVLPSRVESPIAAWGGIELRRAFFEPIEGVQGSRVEVTYDWARTGAGPQEDASWLVVLFTDAEGNFPIHDGVIQLHGIHRPFDGNLPLWGMKGGRIYREKDVILIPSNFPPGEYRVVAALQKGVAPTLGSPTSPFGSFLEDDRQGTSKFSGRPFGGSLLSFTQGPGGEGFWPVTGSTLRPLNGHFVPLVKLRIKARTD